MSKMKEAFESALETMLASYVETALWSSMDQADESGGEPLDANYGPDDIAPACLASMELDCRNFLISNIDDIGDHEYGRAGHDFWLTRNGHGAGFWDGGPWSRQAGKRLTDASRPYGGVDLYVGDDGQIHGGE